MVALFHLPLSQWKRNPSGNISLRGFFFILFAAFGLLASTVLAPAILVACFGGVKAGCIFAGVIALVFAFFYGEANAQGWKSGMLSGSLNELFVAPMAFGVGVAFTLFILSVSSEPPGLGTTMIAAMVFVATLTIGTCLWFLFRAKVWKSK